MFSCSSQIGDYYADRQKWDKAFTFYTKVPPADNRPCDFPQSSFVLFLRSALEKKPHMFNLLVGCERQLSEDRFLKTLLSTHHRLVSSDPSDAHCILTRILTRISDFPSQFRPQVSKCTSQKFWPHFQPTSHVSLHLHVSLQPFLFTPPPRSLYLFILISDRRARTFRRSCSVRTRSKTMPLWSSSCISCQRARRR